MRLIALLLENDFLRMLFAAADDEPDTAVSWMTTLIVTAALAAGLIFAFKGLRKYLADIAKRKIWTRGQTWLMIFVGLFPIFFALLAIWYLNRDYLTFVQIGELFTGTLFAWIIYLVLVILGHLVSPWRRELV